jgi:hypothetical protein
MLTVDGATTALPAFSLRFERGRGHLVLARPFEVSVEGVGQRPAAVGRVLELDLDLGPTRGGVRLHGGWGSVRTHRTELMKASLELDVGALALATLARAPGAAGLFATLEGAVPGAASGLRVSFRSGRQVLAADLHPRWRDGDLLLALRQVRAAGSRGAGALAELLELLGAAGVHLDATAGVVVIPRPWRRLLAEALLPLGMRVPVTRAVPLAPPIVAVDERGRAVVRLAAGEPAPVAARPGEAESERVHAEARLLAAFSSALSEGDLAAARHELGRVRDRLDAGTLDEMRALLALAPAESSAELEDVSGPGLLPSLLRARRAAGREAAERSVRAWLEQEPSDWLAGALLVRTAEDAALEDRPRARWLARRAAGHLARLAVATTGDPDAALSALVRRAIELAQGELPRDLVEDLLPALGLSGALDASAPLEDPSPALALALETLGRGAEAERVWEGLRGEEDAETAALLAARDEQRGEKVAALEGWDRAGQLSARLGRSADARRAWVRSAELALSLKLEEAASIRLERALDTLHAITAEDAVALVSAVRRAGLVELAGRVEQMVIVAISADGGESADLVGALEELMAWAIERGAATRARALHATLSRVRPERAGLDPLPSEPAEPEEPRRLAERLRNEGRLAEAASTLADLGKRDRDAATLRAALDLAERAGAREVALGIVETLLGWIGDGPVAEGLRRRRERLTAG